jgi:hypothetical protein
LTVGSDQQEDFKGGGNTTAKKNTALTDERARTNNGTTIAWFLSMVRDIAFAMP